MDDARIVEHYSAGELLSAIERGLGQLGIEPTDATVDDLGPVDEFHIGGRPATIELLEHLGLDADDHVLDVGCGIGGTARLIASSRGCRVTGLDLVPEFVEVGRTLNSWTGLDDQIDLEVASALAMPFPDATFDAATQLHVGMNVADKAALFAEVRRVVRSGGAFGVYDIMRTSDADITYPVPWSSDDSTCRCADLDTYVTALEQAGFEVTSVEDRREFAEGFFRAMKQTSTERGGPPPLGLHLIFGRAAPDKLANMVSAVMAGTVSPTRVVAIAR